MVTEQKLFFITRFLPRRSCRRDRNQHVHSREAHGNGESVAVLAVRLKGESFPKTRAEAAYLAI